MTTAERNLFKKIYEYLFNVQKNKKSDYVVGICSIFNLLNEKTLKSIVEIAEFSAFAPKNKWDIIDWLDKKYLYPSTWGFWWLSPVNNKDKLIIEERLTAIAFMLTMPKDIVPEFTKQKKTKKKKK